MRKSHHQSSKPFLKLQQPSNLSLQHISPTTQTKSRHSQTNSSTRSFFSALHHQHSTHHSTNQHKYSNSLNKSLISLPASTSTSSPHSQTLLSASASIHNSISKNSCQSIHTIPCSYSKSKLKPQTLHPTTSTTPPLPTTSLCPFTTSIQDSSSLAVSLQSTSPSPLPSLSPLLTIPTSSLISPVSFCLTHSHISSSFKSTPNAQYVSRLLVIGTLGFAGYQYWAWKTGNKRFFEMMEKLDQGDKTALDANPEYKARLEAEKEAVRTRDDQLRVPKLAKEFAREIIQVPDDSANLVQNYEESLGIIEDDFKDDGKYDKQAQTEYLRLLISTYDKLIMPSCEFNTNMTTSEAAAILRLTHEPSRQEISEAFRDLMRINHPDVGGSAYLANKISTAKELLWEGARNDTSFVAKKEKWDQIHKVHEEKAYTDQVNKRLEIIQRRREIMEFRRKQWGTSEMNREPMVVENEASRRVHNLDFGILQMNRGEWPTITFAGWKPRVFRSLEEDERWDEYKQIRHELKHSEIRREIEQFEVMQQHDYDMIKFEQGRWQQQKRLQEFRPHVSHHWNWEDEVTPNQYREGTRHWSRDHAHHIGEFKERWKKRHYGEYQNQRLFRSYIEPITEYANLPKRPLAYLRKYDWKRHDQHADPAKYNANSQEYHDMYTNYRHYPQD